MKASVWSSGGRVVAALALGAAAQVLAGCNGFFVYPGSTTTTNTTVGDVAYVADSISGVQYLNAYSIGSGTLAAATGSPIQLSATPVAMVVTPSDGFLYVAESNASIYAYAIGAGGALTIANNGAAAAGELAASMDITPDGKTLFVLDGTTVTSPFMTQYTINSTTGALSEVAQIPFTPITQTVSLQSLKVAPSGDFVVVSLGAQGDFVYPYTASTLVLNTAGYNIPTGSTVLADSALAIDANNNLYIARNGLLLVYTVSALGVPSAQAINTQTVSGSAPYSLVTSSSGAYVYESLASTSQISGYTVASSASTVTLAAITGSPASPFSAPPNVAAMARDSSGDYVVAAGYNSASGVQLFKIDSNGALTSVASQGTLTGTSEVTPIIAMTH